jgi:hypothetical protein
LASGGLYPSTPGKLRWRVYFRAKYVGILSAETAAADGIRGYAALNNPQQETIGNPRQWQIPSHFLMSSKGVNLSLNV